MTQYVVRYTMFASGGNIHTHGLSFDDRQDALDARWALFRGRASELTRCWVEDSLGERQGNILTRRIPPPAPTEPDGSVMWDTLAMALLLVLAGALGGLLVRILADL